MPSVTDSPDVLCQFIVDKLKANYALLTAAVSGVTVSSPDDIYYGDQDKFPRSPSICVEPGTLDRELMGVSFRTNNTITFFVFVYHARVQDNQATRKEAQQISEVVTTLLNNDPQLGGNAIHSYTSTNESGYVYRKETMYRTNRITFQVFTKTRLR